MLSMEVAKYLSVPNRQFLKACSLASREAMVKKIMLATHSVLYCFLSFHSVKCAKFLCLKCVAYIECIIY